MTQLNNSPNNPILQARLIRPEYLDATLRSTPLADERLWVDQVQMKLWADGLANRLSAQEFRVLTALTVRAETWVEPDELISLLAPIETTLSPVQRLSKSVAKIRQGLPNDLKEAEDGAFRAKIEQTFKSRVVGYMAMRYINTQQP